MNSNKVSNISIKGIDQSWEPEIGGAYDITAARVDPLGGGLLFDRGIEPFWDFGSSFATSMTTAQISTYLGGRIDACFVWTKQSTEQIYYIVEQAGTLYYWLGNKNGGGFLDDIAIIATDRHIPKLNEPGTQFIPYGNRLLIINGYNKPIWFYGRELSRDFSFSIPTGTPEVLDIQPGYLLGTEELEQGIASPKFPKASARGLGDPDAAKLNQYDYKITFITDTGSESPISGSNGLAWETLSGAATQKKFGVFLKTVPRGPRGTSARRIYRTKNQKTTELSGAADEVYYLVKQINDNVTLSFIDTTPDGSLITEAPGVADTSLISTGYQYGASWNGSVWLAGGSLNPTRIIYSKKGLPEQFGAADYFDIGATAGGAITGVIAYYNNLLVFRQRAVEVVRVGPGGDYTISQVNSEIGTAATNTIKMVPNIGVVFLSYDGLYVITGGLDGGSRIDITSIGEGLQKEIDRINPSAIARACAAFSIKEREYWCHFPEEGTPYNSRGIVLHTDTKQFTLRHSQTYADTYKWYFISMCCDHMGNFVLGTLPTWLLANGTASTPTTLNAIGYLAGLQIWSGNSKWGKVLTLNTISGQGLYTYGITEAPLPPNVFESSWINFGASNQKYKIFSVEAEIATKGDNLLYLDWASNWSTQYASAGGQKQARSEVVFTTSEDPVLGPQDATISKSFFTIGTSKLQDTRIVKLRWDVNTGLVDNFRFKIYASEIPFHLISFNILAEGKDQTALNQRINIQKGQPGN